ncbi:hypothetical protein ACPV5L_15505 [Vibrio astriarenae]|uniref:DUF1236 domain-containing protein n=1 Tax=Vibrio agarivorans TaxID=153622 RepID=A0ABT7Y3T4_9VIBR|nr:hypothetical protein [Vibrio agarivorans]MDN2482657.1 hypothetical protein [Vibrio agarivorans]
MTHSITKRFVVAGTLLMLVSTPILAKQPPVATKKPKGKSVVVIKPSHRPVKKAPVHRSYHYKKVPAGATFVLIAGISYAVINNAYYKRSSDTYVYVEQPPVSASTTQTTTVTNTAPAIDTSNHGKIVDVLPSNVTTVTVDGATFYVQGSDWYAPIAGTNQFVIIEPQF